MTIVAVSPLSNYLVLGDATSKVYIWQRFQKAGGLFYYKELYDLIEIPNICSKAV